MTNTWESTEQAREFLTRSDRIPYRGDGETVLVDDMTGVLPGRILDLGCGDGRLTAFLLASYPESTATLVDLSDTMLDAARQRFAGDDRVSFAQHRLDDPLPFDGPFDAIVSSLAIHHVTDERKRTLYAEIARLLAPGGVFANLEIVASPTQELHDRWRDEMGARDDPSDKLRDLASQLTWIEEAGLTQVDCIWKWRSLALLRGERSAD